MEMWEKNSRVYEEGWWEVRLEREAGWARTQKTQVAMLMSLDFSHRHWGASEKL